MKITERLKRMDQVDFSNTAWLIYGSILAIAFFIFAVWNEIGLCISGQFFSFSKYHLGSLAFFLCSMILFYLSAHIYRKVIKPKLIS